ncbi:hypothetical protein IQ06DRAFT_89714 [Phaeosphaeriaceae sp. SRC1lsM3a]|nr:hypothetical protein IQ06DRAFT_89714 [Stagonospora sp. SRC1lsM3a]
MSGSAITLSLGFFSTSDPLFQVAANNRNHMSQLQPRTRQHQTLGSRWVRISKVIFKPFGQKALTLADQTPDCGRITASNNA